MVNKVVLILRTVYTCGLGLFISRSIVVYFIFLWKIYRGSWLITASSVSFWGVLLFWDIVFPLFFQFFLFFLQLLQFFKKFQCLFCLVFLFVFIHNFFETIVLFLIFILIFRAKISYTDCFSSGSSFLGILGFYLDEIMDVGGYIHGLPQGRIEFSIVVYSQGSVLGSGNRAYSITQEGQIGIVFGSGWASMVVYHFIDWISRLIFVIQGWIDGWGWVRCNSRIWEMMGWWNTIFIHNFL